MYTCSLCGKKYKPKGYSTEKNTQQRFCSKDCYYTWLKSNAKYRLPKNTSGINNPRYIDNIQRTKICEWCNNAYTPKNAYIAQKANNRFCSNKCRRDWYSNVWSQSPEWRKNRSDSAVEQLARANRKTSGAQSICNSLLTLIGVLYQNEIAFKPFAVDVYIAPNLVIEVMGTFYHADIRYYPTIKYKMQVDRVIRDKAKQSYFRNHLGINVLYLWEYDLINNAELCKLLIISYLDNNGVLDNYHSMNYLNDAHKLIINDIKIVPYMELDINETLTHYAAHIKRPTFKQLDKWGTYTCSYCGKNFERLMTHAKAKSLFCSHICSSNSRKK